MFRPLCGLILFLACLISVFNPSFGGYFIKPVNCTNASVNLNYNPPLPAASTKTFVTTTAQDSGVWQFCQLGPVRSYISYYLALTATNANCEKATFTNFIFTGFFNCTSLFQQPAASKNFTVPLSDPSTVRYLNQSQPFLGPVVIPISVEVPGVLGVQTSVSVTVPGFGLLFMVNFTFIFPTANHQPNTCGQIRTEQVQIIPQLFLFNTSDDSGTPLPVPTILGCNESPIFSKNNLS